MRIYKVGAVALMLFFKSMLQLHAQATFPVVWESKFDNEADYLKYTTMDGKYVIGTTKQDVCVLDGTTGKKIWMKTYLELTGNKKAKDQEVNEDAGVIMMISTQTGNDKLFCVDLQTGNKVWENTNYNGIQLSDVIYVKETKTFVVVLDKGLVFIDALTGVEKGTVEGIRGVPGRWVYLPEKKQFIILCYQVNGLKAIADGLQNTILCIDADQMKVVWKTKFTGVVEIKRYAVNTFSVFSWAAVGVSKGIGSSNILVDMYSYKDRLIVVFGGLKVYDINSGNLQWQVEYDVSLNRGLAGSTQMYGAVADPYFTDQFVYVAAFEKGRDKSIRKYDMANGKLIWETPIDGRKVIIPNLLLVDGKLVLQIGGYVNIQGSQTGQYGTTYFSKWEWQGPFGLKAFDESTGKLMWQTEKFDDRITNIMQIGNNLYVADKTHLYSVNLQTGANNFEVETKPAKVGEPCFVFSNQNDICLFTENGIIAYTPDGKFKYAYKIKDLNIDGSVQYGNTYYLKNEDGLFAVDLNTGKETGKYEYMKDFKYGFKENGKSLFLLGEKKVLKYSLSN